MRGRKKIAPVCKVCFDDNPINFYGFTRNKCKECCKLASKERQSINGGNKNYYKNIIRIRFLTAQRRAKVSNMEFDLTIDFLNELLKSQNNRCFYSGRLFDESPINSVSIDRTNNNLGYTKGNIRLVTSAINYMKRALSEVDFLSIIHDIKNNLK